MPLKQTYNSVRKALQGYWYGEMKGLGLLSIGFDKTQDAGLSLIVQSILKGSNRKTY